MDIPSTTGTRVFISLLVYQKTLLYSNEAFCMSKMSENVRMRFLFNTGMNGVIDGLGAGDEGDSNEAH